MPPVKRPSFYLMTFCLMLVVSAAVGLSEESSLSADPLTAPLLARGWVYLDHVDCDRLQPRAFYELSNERESAEFFTASDGRYLASRPALPEPPYECRPISEPHFIEEIL